MDKIQSGTQYVRKHNLLSRERLLIAIRCSSWDEKRVGEWLRAINCAQYEQLFKGTIFSSVNSVTCGDT